MVDFSCVHAVRARSVRRGEPLTKCATRGAAGQAGDDGGTVVDDAKSTVPLPLYNGPRSVLAIVKMCSKMREGEVSVVRAPRGSPNCGTARKGDVRIDEGEFMCSEGFTVMQIESFCDGKDCQRSVFPDGCSEGLVILS